jgi:hypothetical protein
MERVPNRIAGESERDDLMNPSAQAILSDISHPIGEIGAKLAAKPVLGRQNKVSLVAALSQGSDRGSGNDQVAAFHKGHIGSHDDNALARHGRPEVARSLFQGFQSFFVVVCFKD